MQFLFPKPSMPRADQVLPGRALTDPPDVIEVPVRVVGDAAVALDREPTGREVSARVGQCTADGVGRLEH